MAQKRIVILKIDQRFLIKTDFGKISGPERFVSKEVGSKKWVKKIGVKKNRSEKLFGSKKSNEKETWVKKIFGSHGPIFKVWLKLDWDIPLDSN